VCIMWNSGGDRYDVFCGTKGRTVIYPMCPLSIMIQET